MGSEKKIYLIQMEVFPRQPMKKYPFLFCSETLSQIGIFVGV